VKSAIEWPIAVVMGRAKPAWELCGLQQQRYQLTEMTTQAILTTVERTVDDSRLGRKKRRATLF
jgi:hypothetical protein